MPGLTKVTSGGPDDAGYSATSITVAAQAADGSPSMAETRKWLGHPGNGSDSLAQDNRTIYPVMSA
jgi:hypothetical protein